MKTNRFHAKDAKMKTQSAQSNTLRSLRGKKLCGFCVKKIG